MKRYILPFLLFGSLATATFAQPTTLVRPRQYTLLSSQLLTNKQAISTNLSLPGQNIGVFTNTLTPYSGSHPIGLTAIIGCTNNLGGNSNVVVAVYPAYDNSGGNSNVLGGTYGTNFATVPIFTWTIAYQSNSTQMTNLAPLLWEPATSLGYTVSNGSTSNITVTLIQSQSP
jgi:hypothetical protein